MIILVEKKNMNTHEYEKIKFMKNSWVINDNSFSRYAL